LRGKEWWVVALAVVAQDNVILISAVRRDKVRDGLGRKPFMVFNALHIYSHSKISEDIEGVLFWFNRGRW
jgi:hypothetical protein